MFLNFNYWKKKKNIIIEKLNLPLILKKVCYLHFLTKKKQFKNKNKIYLHKKKIENTQDIPLKNQWNFYFFSK